MQGPNYPFAHIVIYDFNSIFSPPVSNLAWKCEIPLNIKNSLSMFLRTMEDRSIYFFTFKVASLLLVFHISHACGKNWEGRLVFHEEFNGKTLNPLKWEKVESCDGRGARDSNLECFTSREDNVRLREGHLIIEAMPEDFVPPQLWVKPHNFTSGRIRMRNDLTYKYGTYVIRTRLAKGTHLLSSIYLLPAYQDHDNCKYEEIDISQARGQRTASLMLGAYYGRQWNHAYVQMTEKVLRNADFSDDFHEFALVWKKYRLEWFLDGKMIHTLPMYYHSDWLLEDESNLPCNMNKSLFQQELQLNINLAVGGSMFPEEVYGKLTYDKARNWTKPYMEIDWIKIYQIS